MKTKNKLMAAVAMLVISTLMLTTASYAWFTISTAPEIKGVKAQMVANQNLEIALYNGSTTPAAMSDKADGAADKTTAAKNITWGNILDLSEIQDLQLKPVNVTGSNVQYPVYGNDGRISSLTNLTATADATNYITTYKHDGGEVWAVRVDFWLRSNVEGAISLSEAVDRGMDAADDGSMGGGSTLKDKEGNAVPDAIKVAIVVGEAQETPETPVNYTFAPDFSNALAGITNTEGVLSGNIVTISSTNINKAIPVSVLLYLDGNEVSNADVATAIDVVLNLQFAHAGITDATDGPMSRD